MFPIQNFHQIRVFYVCAQVGSFSEASNVLGCSQSAVSQSIKQTEMRLGFDLFQRSGKGVSLTPSGRRFLQTLQTSWSQIERSAATEKRSAAVSTIRLCAPPSFTLNWLLPRVANFYDAQDNIHIQFETKENIFHSDESDADLVITYWAYDRPILLDETLFPVCSPEFARKNDLCADMDDVDLVTRLASVTMIGEDLFPFGTRLDGWIYWAQKFGMDMRGVAMRRHALSHISLREAELGLGVALGRSTLCEDALDNGRLICLSGTKIRGPYQYYIEKNTDSDAARQVEKWLIEMSNKSHRLS